MVEMGAGKDQQGLKTYLVLPLEIKRKISSSAWAQGDKQPRTNQDTERKEYTETTLGFNPDFEVKGSGKTKTTLIP